MVILERRKDFIQLSNNTIIKIVSQFFSQKVLHHELIKSGLATTNYLVLLDKGKKIILRVNDFEHKKNAIKQYHISKKLSDMLYIPKVLHITEDSSSQLTYSLVEYCEGYPMNQLKNKANLVPLYAQLAKFLINLSRFTYSKFGLFDENLAIKSIKTEITSHHPYVNYMLDCLNNSALKARLSSGKINKIKNFIYKNECLLDRLSDQFRLTHGDFKSDNILIKEQRSNILLTGVIDWEYARSDLIYSDIATIFRGKYLANDAGERLIFVKTFEENNQHLDEEWFMLSKFIDFVNLLSFISSKLERPNFYKIICHHISKTIEYFENEYHQNY